MCRFVGILRRVLFWWSLILVGVLSFLEEKEFFEDLGVRSVWWLE